MCAVPINENISWPLYIKECGIEQMQKNSREAKILFNMHYANRGVEWEGYVVRVKVEEDVDPLNMLHHSATILVKMDTDDIRGQSADLGLAISMESLTRMQDTIN